MARDPYKYFRIEARELQEQLQHAVLALEKQTAPETVSRLLRVAHTLKGAARVVKRTDIADRAHAIEDLMQPLREAGASVSRELIDGLLAHLDVIGAQIASLSAPESASAPADAAEAEASAEAETSAEETEEDRVRTVRTDVRDVEVLLDGVAETHMRLGALRAGLGKQEEIRQLLESLRAHLAIRPGAQVDRALEQARTLAARIAESVEGLGRDLAAGAEQVDRELRLVHDAAERMRLSPAGSIFIALERAVHDAARALGKEATFEARGGELRLDGHVLETVHAALVQVVRNAVAHGIETPDERQRASKPAAGRVLIEVTQRGDRVEFACSDDGRGIDAAAIRRLAEKKGLLRDKGAQDTASLLDLLLEGGISTSDTVTAVSGRGIGLDVVRDAAARLGGKVAMQTELGRGTRFTLSVPLTLSAMEGLLMKSGGQVVIIPMDAVQSASRIVPGELMRSAEGEGLIHEGARVPFVALADVLGADDRPSSARQATSVVILRTDQGAAAVGVDHLLGASSVVLRALPELAPAADYVAGAALDADGDPMLVFDPPKLVAEVRRRSGRLQTDAPARLPILVIDDSLTTRMLERSILESAGYEVGLAASGEEALQMARANRYGLFLVDVEMPGMDGFTFIELTRADPELRQVPCILVTSRNSPDDLRRGKEVGAHAHIVKSEFDQNTLLSHIEELLT